MKTLGILISGRGSNMVSILEGIRSGDIPARVGVVISNKSKAPGLARAASFAVPTAVITRRSVQGQGREAHDRLVAARLDAAGVDLVCLAGYMRILSPWFIEHYQGRILNIHPALLPSFPGLHGQRQALEQGARIAGCTVHFVDAQVDHGPTIVQAAVPVLATDDEESLCERILVQEHRIYPLAVKWAAEDRPRIVDGHVVVEGEAVDGPGSMVVPYGVT